MTTAKQRSVRGFDPTKGPGDTMKKRTLDRRSFLSLASGAAAGLLHARSDAAKATPVPDYDIVIYGGSSAGVMAAVQARRMGKTAVIVNPYGFLGGMTASGLNAADVSNPAAVSGMAREFFGSMGKAYGLELAKEFESHVAEQAFDDLAKSAGVPIHHHERLDLRSSVILKDRRIESIRTASGRVFSGRMFIDATYEGDLMAAAAVSYCVGREGNAKYDETLNGFLLAEAGDVQRISDIGADDHFIEDVDPYLKRGDPASGLLPRISRALRPNGAGDSLVQAYNYRVTLTDDPTNQVPFIRPEGYDELDHELLLRNFAAGDVRLPGRIGKLPNGKIDWNTFGGVGTDMAGASTQYPEGDHETRARIDRQHETYTRGHFWTLAHHPRVPESIRAEMRRWGYAKDEFQRNGGFPYMLYLREGRRMVGAHVMTEHHCRHDAAVSDPVALASFSMDSHVVQYVVNKRGFVEREGVFLKRCKGPYGISYRSIVPRPGECPNLFVPVCLSASHVAYGSIRMEPVFMSLAQACATAASIAIDRKVSVQNVPYAPLRKRLLADGVMLEWKS